MNAINAFQPNLGISPAFNLGNAANLGAANGPALGFSDLMPGTAGNFGPLGSMDFLQMMLAQMLSGQYPGLQDPSMMQNYAQNTAGNPALNYGGGGGGGGGIPSFGGGGGGSSPSYSVGGNNGSSPSYGANQTSSSNAANSTSSPSGTSGAAGTGQRAVDIARNYEGQPSRTIGMDNYDAPGGNTNNCAAFVTGALKTAGKIDWTEAGVSNGNLREKLLADGWREIPGTEAKPGDVMITDNSKHTELVSEAGGTKTIGSNNVRPGYQEISERVNDPSKGTYYTKDEPEVTEAKAAADAAEAKAAAPDATAEDKAKAEAAKSDVKSAEAKAEAAKTDAKASDAKSADAKASDSKTETKSADAKSEKSSTSTSSDKSKSESSGSSSSGSKESSGSKGSTSGGGSTGSSGGSSSAGGSKGSSGSGGSSGGSSGSSSKA